MTEAERRYALNTAAEGFATARQAMLQSAMRGISPRRKKELIALAIEANDEAMDLCALAGVDPLAFTTQPHSNERAH